MGGFQLVSWRPAIADLFIEGVEIETYKTFAELLDKINYYLSNDTERRKIIDNGYKRVHKDHTYTNRLIEIFDKF
jgi:spore maturation protein CgeB